MIEITGNLWEVPADIRVITTNGFVKKNGAAVMGRGCALEAKTKFPGIEYQLGNLLTRFGNHVFNLGEVVTFPVKHNWWEPADPKLIQRSASELLTWVNDGHTTGHYESIVIPRPGCGNGQLNWSDIKPLLTPILDDRFSIITF